MYKLVDFLTHFSKNFENFKFEGFWKGECDFCERSNGVVDVV